MPEIIKRQNTDHLIDPDYTSLIQLLEQLKVNDELVLAKLGNKQAGRRLRVAIRKVNKFLSTVKSESTRYAPD
ncbi:MAG: hypothetical protein E6R13_01275 [Spirochaetes bacterium]|nr:MAG: hypothetical protein E6R13_01275 [Spirochaetota bacterium]